MKKTPKDRITFSVAVDRGVRRQLDKLARAEDHSLGHIVRRAINADLEHRARKTLAA